MAPALYGFRLIRRRLRRITSIDARLRASPRPVSISEGVDEPFLGPPVMRNQEGESDVAGSPHFGQQPELVITPG